MNFAIQNQPNVRSLKDFKAAKLGEVALFLLTMLLWIDRILLTYIRRIFMIVPIIGSFVDYIIIAVYIVLIIMALPQIFKNIRLIDGIFGSSVAIVCVLNFIVFPNNTEVLREYIPSFLFLVFPLYYIGVSLDFEKIYPWLYKLSLITIVAFTVYKLFVSAPMDDVQSMYAGDMWSSYNILPHVCVVSLSMLKKPSVINISATVIGVIMIALLGSRGPLICLVLATAVYLVFFKKYKRPVLAFFVIIVTTVLIVMGLDTIMRWLYDLSKDAGLSIRIFEKYFEGSFSDSSTRDVIAEQLYYGIAENPFLGYGMFSDRVAVGTYAHHIAIELWYSFGVIFGTAVLFGIVVILLRAARVVKKVERYAVLFIPLLFAGFIKLFLSNSFLEEIYLYWLLGIAINFIRSGRKLD